MNPLRIITLLGFVYFAVTTSTGAEASTVESQRKAVMELLSGEKLTGELLNTNLTFRTPYARMMLDCASVSQLELAAAPGEAQCLVSVRQDRLTGLLEDDCLFMRDGSNGVFAAKRETISTIRFAPGGSPSSKTASPMLFRMRNGDTLHGWFNEESLRFQFGSQANMPTAVTPAEVLTITFSTAGECDLVLKDGRQSRGRLTGSELSLRLEIGPSITVNAASLTSAKAREALDLHLASARRGNLQGPYGIGLVWVHEGEFTMGSPQTEAGRDADEGPLTKVRIPEGFWMSRNEITQEQFAQVMGSNPSSAGGTNLPVEKVTWTEAIEFCRRLNRLADAAGTVPEGFNYRLPTEAEWEYACRAGTQTRFSYGDDPTGAELERYAWFTRNSESTTHPVGTRLPNAWGLYDMHGNVWEWCLDRWEGGLPGGSITNRPTTPEGSLRVARGGAWLYDAKACRSANRDDYSTWNRCSDIGFRVVLAPINQ
jgi:formylglycine-generating enzyme required for sulfatase activity